MTHIGRRRNTNEDQFLIAELDREVTIKQASTTPLGGASKVRSGQGQVLAIADGMGGHAGGSIASGVVIETIAQVVLGSLPWISASHDGAMVEEALRQGLLQCQRRLEETDGPARMGTTATIAYVSWPRLFLAHVGDSRCYLFRQGDLQQLTHDHTMAQRLIDDRKMPADEIGYSPLRDVLWNAVGGGSSDISPEVSSLELLKGDSLLLCTDGLTKHVPERTIAALLAEPTNASPTCERLVEAANAGGGTDNITVIIARY